MIFPDFPSGFMTHPLDLGEFFSSSIINPDYLGITIEHSEKTDKNPAGFLRKFPTILLTIFYVIEDERFIKVRVGRILAKLS